MTRAHPSATGAHPFVMRAQAVVRRADRRCRRLKAVVSRHNTICTPDNRLAIVCNRVVRHADEGNTYNNSVVMRHNTVVIACNRICRLAGKEKTIVGAVRSALRPLLPARRLSTVTRVVRCRPPSGPRAERAWGAFIQRRLISSNTPPSAKWVFWALAQPPKTSSMVNSFTGANCLAYLAAILASRGR